MGSDQIASPSENVCSFCCMFKVCVFCISAAFFYLSRYLHLETKEVVIAALTFVVHVWKVIGRKTSFLLQS